MDNLYDLIKAVRWMLAAPEYMSSPALNDLVRAISNTIRAYSDEPGEEMALASLILLRQMRDRFHAEWDELVTHVEVLSLYDALRKNAGGLSSKELHDVLTSGR